MPDPTLSQNEARPVRGQAERAGYDQPPRRTTLDDAHEMAVLAAVEAGTPEDCADAALKVVLAELREFVSLAPKRETDGERLSATEMAVMVLNWIDGLGILDA